ncbi:hypothetical protein HZS_2803 [Henneguya salminicola]|nr:hypothetical protein HZS_2803 [Henneguya salminicola]
MLVIIWGFSAKILYRKGEENQNAGAFSRLTSNVQKLIAVDTDLWLIVHIPLVVNHVTLGQI